MPYTTLMVERSADVAELHLTSKRGALGPAFWQELPAALLEVGDARVVILRPGGPDFSVGLDLVQTAPVLATVMQEQGGFLNLLAGMQEAIEAVVRHPAPVVAVTSGWCIGAGLELIAACDVRVCSSDARFSLPEVKLGIVSDLGGLARLPRLVGEGWARRLALTGEAISAERAERIGLVSEVLPTPQEALERARALAQVMAEHSATALHGTKRAMNARLDADVQAHYRETGEWNAEHLRPEHFSIRK